MIPTRNLDTRDERRDKILEPLWSPRGGLEMNPIKVLLVEDDELTRRSLAGMMRREQYEVIPAADAEEAVRTVGERQPDIVVTDYKLPGLSGLDLMSKLGESRAALPVILITGYGEVEVAIQALRLGAVDYLKKPIELEDLHAALDRAKAMVERRRAGASFPTVLLAEDDEVARRNLASVLVREGYHVVQAADGREAVERFERTKVDVLLFDIRMPELDGLSALRALRARTDDFVAIVVTGYSDESAAIQALRGGALGFIKKPVDLEELLSTMQHAVDRLSSERALRYRSLSTQAEGPGCEPPGESAQPVSR